jgi:Carboxypeptidase regulatory-like domain
MTGALLETNGVRWKDWQADRSILSTPAKADLRSHGCGGREHSMRTVKNRLFLLILALALLSTTSAVAAASQIETNQPSASVTGTITDLRGDPVPGATALLTQPSSEKAKTALADREGSFLIPVDAGVFDLQVSMPGFSSKAIHGEVSGTEKLDLGKIELAIEAATAEVIVTVSKQELAEEQVKVEERQRVLGVVPNFLVTYDHNAVPLRAKQKFELALRTLTDPETIAVDLVFSGLQQKSGGFKAYGTGPDGYAKRVASSYGTSSIDALLGSALLPSLFKQDPRYFYKGDGSVKQRALYAMSMSFLCKGDNGHWQYNYSGLLGGLAVGGISNLYYPSANRNSLNVTLENIAIGTGSSALSNLFQEFLLRRLTRHPKQ